MDPNFGQPFTKETEKLLIDYLHDDKVRGLSILGGEPFQNEVGLIKFLTRLRRETPKEIWIYSGYTFEEIMAVPIKRELLELCDVLVDGRFVDELKNLKLKFRGSSNQRIIDIKKSLSENRVVLYGNYNE